MLAILNNLPWWAYLIIVVIVIALGFVIYNKLTAYTPPTAQFNPDEAGLPPNFDVDGEAAAAYAVFNSYFGTGAATLFTHLNSLSDNEIIAVYNAYSSKYFSDRNKTLTQEVQHTYNFGFGASQATADLLAKMQRLDLA